MAPGQSGPDAEERLLWEGRPQPLLLWLLALGGLGIGLFPLWSLADPGHCGSDCPGSPVWWFFALLSGLIGLISLPVVILLPLGGLQIRYALSDRRFIISRRILGRLSRREFAMPGQYFWLGRGNQINLNSYLPGKGTAATLICLTRRDRDALRDALPEGAWR